MRTKLSETDLIKGLSDFSMLKDQITENMLLLDTVHQEILTLCTIHISRQVLALQQTAVHHMLSPISGTTALANKILAKFDLNLIVKLQREKSQEKNEIFV